MELRQLRYFVRIVETGSMGSAALDLNIGVSALSQQMSRLENELAIRLLQRTSRGVTPTSAGRAFYSQAQLALRHADDAILAARESRLSGHVSVGMAPSTASVLGMLFIHAMRESYSDVRLHVVESLSGNLERMHRLNQDDPEGISGIRLDYTESNERKLRVGEGLRRLMCSMRNDASKNLKRSTSYCSANNAILFAPIKTTVKCLKTIFKF